MMAGDMCSWCRSPRRTTRASLYCSKRCRQAAFRSRRAFVLENGAAVADSSQPTMRFAYADPPYPGFAKECYGDHPDYGGEVDHAELIKWLSTQNFDGWALSSSAAALSFILPLCPKNARVCAWVKPIGVSGLTRGLHSTWEPLIVVCGRRRRPGMRDFISCQPARLGGSSLIGRKPQRFCAFLFAALGMLPGDRLLDMFPGSGGVARAWIATGGFELRTDHPWERSPEALGDAVAIAAGDASPAPARAT